MFLSTKWLIFFWLNKSLIMAEGGEGEQDDVSFLRTVRLKTNIPVYICWSCTEAHYGRFPSILFKEVVGLATVHHRRFVEK